MGATTDRAVVVSKRGFPRCSAKYGIILLLALHLFPIWAFTFIPTQDGLNHIYNAYIIKEYDHPDYTKYREVYEKNIKPFPNWTAHAFFLATLYVMPPLVAEKLFVTLCVVAVPLSLFYFLKQVDRRLMFFGLLGFLYSYHHLLHLGFYGFSLSFPLYFLALGYWWKHRTQLTLRSALILNLLAFATYFAHLFSYAMLLLSVSVLALTEVGLICGSSRTFGERIRDLARTVVALMPAYVVMLMVLLLNPESSEKQHRSLERLWEYFLSVGSLVSFNDRAVPLMWALLIFMGGCLLWTILRDKVRDKILLSQRDGFLLLFGVSVVL